MKQVLIQLVNDSPINDEPDSYRWGVINDSGQWQTPPCTGDKTALLLSLQSTELPIFLVIPGEKVVTTRVAYSPAEKRHFRQLLPYQLEEQIIGNVEDVHFAIGPLRTDNAIVSYVDKAWFAETVAWHEEHGFIINRCVADFQLLTPAVDQWIIWSTGSRVVCFHGSGLGFSTHCTVLQPLLADVFTDMHRQTAMLSDKENTDSNNENIAKEDSDGQTFAHAENSPASNIQLYGDSEQALDYLIKCLPDAIRQQATRCIGEPALNLLGNNRIDFCQGAYAKKLPFDHWWQALRSSAILAVAALLAFIAVNLLDVYQLKDRQHLVNQQIEQRYRQAIPQGVMVDPVKQLQNKLGTTDADRDKSQATYLISVVAPAIKAQKIDVTTLAYNDNNKELRLNIEANAFNVIEKLRKQLQVDGLQAQLKRSDSSDDTVRARLHISIGEE